MGEQFSLGPNTNALPQLNQSQVALMLGRKQPWVSKTVPAPAEGSAYCPRRVVAWFVERLEAKHAAELERLQAELSGDLAAVMLRKRTAEAANAEEQLKLNRLKVQRQQQRLMPVDVVHHVLEQIGLELRKATTILQRRDEGLCELVLDALDRGVAAAARILQEEEMNGDGEHDGQQLINN